MKFCTALHAAPTSRGFEKSCDPGRFARGDSPATSEVASANDAVLFQVEEDTYGMEQLKC